MKEDVLEQIVDDYLNSLGYFTTHNVRFKPDRGHAEFDGRKDSVPSDIDVVAFHPRKRGRRKVMVVNCKAWQRGFDPFALLEQLEARRPNPKRERWHQFRELWIPKWSEAFHKTVFDLTGQTKFEYRIAFTRLRGSLNAERAAAEWRKNETIAGNLAGSGFGFLPLEQMWAEVLEALTTTPAASEIGRLAQLLKAAGLTAREPVAAPQPPEPGSDAAHEAGAVEPGSP